MHLTHPLDVQQVSRQKTNSKMLRRSALLVWLICGFTHVCESAMGATAASEKDCYRKTCMGRDYDIRKAVCCENQLHPGAMLSCCGAQAFNPEEATCCKDDGDGVTKAAVTQGLSEKVSACCGLKAYNEVNEICCQSTVIAKPAPNAKCCGKGRDAYDVDKQLCCGRPDNKTILWKESSDHVCCGHNQYNTKTECCSWKKAEGLKTQPISSSYCVKESEPSEIIRNWERAGAFKTYLADLCGMNAYNKFHELCCNSTVVAKPASNVECCGDSTFNTDTELCCGPPDNKTILLKESSAHVCCGHNQYNTKTECCCSNPLRRQPINSSCCVEESGVQPQRPAPQPSCTEQGTSLCGSSCYNPAYLRCCERNKRESQKCCSPGRCDDAPTVYNPRTHVCCDGCVSEWKHQKNHFHGWPGQHHCGTEVYQPHTEICCDGHRHHKKENTHCCGVKAYNIKDPQMKCCAGTLHLLSGRLGHDAQCCGATLQTPLSVCCSSEDNEVLYSAKTGFGCCGHFYFNVSIWSCCAGKLSPWLPLGQHQSKMIKESRLLSVNNLNEADLCDEMHIGTVESVSLHSIVFSSVLKIHGRSATVTPLASPHILKTPDYCSFPKLTPGKNYFFDKVNVFTDFNHDSIPQSLHFIISKCYRH